MNGDANNPLLEAGLRHELTSAEHAGLQAYLADHPEQAEDADLDLKLNELLRQLPDRPLASHFTAQVLLAVQRQPVRSHRLSTFWDRLAVRRWVPRLAVVVLVLVAGTASYHGYRVHRRVVLARSVVEFSRLSAVVSLEVLRDYDAIRRFSQARVKDDDELFAALQ